MTEQKTQFQADGVGCTEIKIEIPRKLAEKFMTLCASRDSTAEAALETVIRLMVAANEEESDA